MATAIEQLKSRSLRRSTHTLSSWVVLAEAREETSADRKRSPQLMMQIKSKWWKY